MSMTTAYVLGSTLFLVWLPIYLLFRDGDDFVPSDDNDNP
jgi:hypothetical protein